MRKISRGRSENDEPLSAGRVEYLEQARQRVRTRRIRRTAVLLVLLTAVVLFATGVVGSSVTMAKDFIDTARIALLPGSGWPQQTGVSEVTQVEPLTGSFVELGKEGLRRLLPQRQKAEQHPERLRPPGSGRRPEPLCALQPVRQ